MKRTAAILLLGAMSATSPALAQCSPTHPAILDAEVILVGEVATYRHLQVPIGEFLCAEAAKPGTPAASVSAKTGCDTISAHEGLATIKVVDALKGNVRGELTLLVTGAAIYGEWRINDLASGQRFIFGLETNKPRRWQRIDYGQNEPQYRISNFERLNDPSCSGPVALATQTNIEKLRETLNNMPFIHKVEDGSLRELPAEQDDAPECWIKQRKGVGWQKVAIPCQ